MPDKYIVLSVDEWIIRVVLFENSTNAANKNTTYLKFATYSFHGKKQAKIYPNFLFSEFRSRSITDEIEREPARF